MSSNRFLLRILPLLLASLMLFRMAAAQQAGCYIVVEAQTRKILLTQNADAKVPVASLTKVATVCVALDWAEKTGRDLASLVTVPASVTLAGGANPVGLQPGDQISIRDLMYACLLGSDNAAAHTLADAVGTDLLRRLGKSANPPGFFVEQMNHLAERLGMDHTKFVNPHGLEAGSRYGVSTAADMARLACYALTKSSFRFFTAQKTKDIVRIRGGQPQTMLLRNTNELLGAGNIDGMKTGMTAASGGCLILTEGRKGTTVRNPNGAGELVFQPRLVVVALGSRDRFRDGAGLLFQGWGRYDQWMAAGRPVKSTGEVLSAP